MGGLQNIINKWDYMQSIYNRWKYKESLVTIDGAWKELENIEAMHNNEKLGWKKLYLDDLNMFNALMMAEKYIEQNGRWLEMNKKINRVVHNNESIQPSEFRISNPSVWTGENWIWYCKFIIKLRD